MKSTREKPLALSISLGGWLYVHGAGVPGLHVRTLPDEAGRLRIVELFLDPGQPITAEALRGLPLAEVEAIANAHPNRSAVLDTLDEGIGDRLGILASRIGSVPGSADDWVAASYREAVEGTGPSKAKRPRAPRGLRDIDFRLSADDMPTGGRLDDSFMRRLARAYAAAVARGESPNMTIAQDVGYPMTKDAATGKAKQEGLRTVQSWVYQARRRDYLPPARKGAAG